MEMHDLRSSGERFSQAVKEVTVDYVPQPRESRLVKVSIVKSAGDTDLADVFESKKDNYGEIEK